MKTVRIIAVAAIAAAAQVAVASAADLPQASPAPAPAPIFVASSWSGFYVGLSGGLQDVSNKWRTNNFCHASLFGGPGCAPAGFTQYAPVAATNNRNFGNTGGRLGAFVGYNIQVNASVVAGVEADMGWNLGSGRSQVGIPGTFPSLIPFVTGTGDRSSSSTQWDGSLRARAGILATPNLLIYGTGGVAWQDFTARASCNGAAVVSQCDGAFLIFPLNAPPHTSKVSKTLLGWTAGLGAEMKLWSNVSARLEYRYSDFGSFNHTFFRGLGHEVRTTHKVATHNFTLGLAYNFWTGSGPVVAKY